MAAAANETFQTLRRPCGQLLRQRQSVLSRLYASHASRCQAIFLTSTSPLRERRLLGLLLVDIPRPTWLWDHLRWDILRLQATPCLAGSAPRRACGLFESFQFALVFFNTTCSPSFSLRSSWHFARWKFAFHGLVFGGSLCRVWNTGYLFQVSLWGALVWGRTCFQGSGWALRDPCLHRVVDNSLLLMGLSVPASSQIFLEVVGVRSRGTYPDLLAWPVKHAFGGGCHVDRFERFSSGLARPISFMQSSCCDWGNKVFSSTCVVTSRGCLSQTTPKERRGCLVSNNQGIVLKRSCLLVSFFGISWLRARTFPWANRQRMDIPRVRALAGAIY